MPVEIHHRDGRVYPVIVSDVTGKQITDTRAAVTSPGSSDEDGIAYFAEKGAPHDALERRINASGWQELSYFVVQLCASLGIDPEEFQNIWKQLAAMNDLM